jgi:hypothetical protein
MNGADWGDLALIMFGFLCGYLAASKANAKAGS